MSRARLPQPRTRGFTGCYTCRDRKLKCDETRPACKRCISLGISCQGYNIKLSWLLYNEDTYLACNRRASTSTRLTDDEDIHCRRPLFTDIERELMTLETQRTSQNRKRDLNVNEAISEIDTRSMTMVVDSSGIEDTSIGPFSVFCLKPSPQPVQNIDRSDPMAPEVETLPGASMVPLFSGETVESDASYDESTPTDLSAETVATWLRADYEEMEESHIPPANQVFGSSTDDVGNYHDLCSVFQVGFDIPDFMSVQNVWMQPEDTTTSVRNESSNHVGVEADASESTELVSTIQHRPPPSDLSFTEIELPMSISNSKNLSKIPPEARFLLEYYSSEVIEFMCLLPNSQSPWRTIHLPCAMSTMADLVVFGKAGHARMALFYALLAVSSYHFGSKLSWSMSAETAQHNQVAPSPSSSKLAQDGLESNNITLRHWLDKGLAFRALSVSHLQACLHSPNNSDSQEKYKELLMSLLSMVTISVTSGDMCDAHGYLAQAKTLIDRHGAPSPAKPSYKSSKVTALHQIFSYLQIIESSTFVSRTVRYSVLYRTGVAETNDFANQRLDRPHTLDSGPMTSTRAEIDALDEDNDVSEAFAKIYGVPRSLLTLISHASDLANELERRQLHEAYVMADADFSDRCQIVEDRIWGWKRPENESPLSELPNNSQIASHLISSIYDALVVMFFRRVRKLNRMILQHYIQSAADHLIQQEELKISGGINASPLVWPWFMVACEALDKAVRQKLRLWAGFARRYGMRNLEKAEQVVTEVWRRQDNCLPNATWVDVVDEWGTNLILT